MATSTAMPVPQRIKNPALTILPADTTTWKDVYTASVDGALVKMLGATSTDTAGQNIELGIHDGTSVRAIGTVPVVANAGTNGTAASADLLDTDFVSQLMIDSNGKPLLQLQGTYKLQARSLVTVTAAKQIDIVGSVEEF